MVSANVNVRPTFSRRPTDTHSWPAGIGAITRTLRSTVMHTRGVVCSFASDPIRMSPQVSSTDGRITAASGTHTSGTASARPRSASPSAVTRSPSSDV